MSWLPAQIRKFTNPVAWLKFLEIVLFLSSERQIKRVRYFFFLYKTKQQQQKTSKNSVSVLISISSICHLYLYVSFYALWKVCERMPFTFCSTLILKWKYRYILLQVEVHTGIHSFDIGYDRNNFFLNEIFNPWLGHYKTVLKFQIIVLDGMAFLNLMEWSETTYSGVHFLPGKVTI